MAGIEKLKPLPTKNTGERIVQQWEASRGVKIWQPDRERLVIMINNVQKCPHEPDCPLCRESLDYAKGT